MHKDATIAMNQYADWAIRTCNFQSKWATFCFQVLLHGFSPMLVYWNVDPITGIGHPDVEPIDIYSFFVDPVKYNNTRNCSEAVVRVYTDLATLYNRSKMGIYDKAKIDEVAKSSASSNSTDNPILHRKSLIGASAPTENFSSRPGQKEVELLIYHTPNKSYTIANRSILIREKENPGRIPIVSAVWSENPFEMYGTGMVEPIASLQHAINAYTNMMVDSKTIELNPAVLIGASNAATPNEEFRAKAGSLIRTVDVNQIRPLVTPSPSFGMEKERDFTMNQSKETDGALDVTRGASGPEETATQASLNNANAATRWALPQQNLETALKDIGTFFQILGQQYLEESTIKLLGISDERFPQNLKKEHLYAQVGFVPVIEPMAPLDKQFRRNQTNQALQNIMQFPAVAKAVQTDPETQSIVFDLIMDAWDIDPHGRLRTAVKKTMQPPPPPIPPPSNPQVAQLPEEAMRQHGKAILEQLPPEALAKFQSLPPEMQARILQEQVGKRIQRMQGAPQMPPQQGGR